MIKLHVVPVQGEPFDHPLVQDSLVLGRASSSDLVLEDRFLSRHHSRIFRQDDDLLIEDLGSRNGTLLNGRPVSQPTRLTPGDVVKISGSVISILTVGEERPAPISPPPGFGEHTIFRSASGLLQNQSVPQSRKLTDAEALRSYAERLDVLIRAHKALGDSMEVDELLDLLLDLVFDHLKPEQGAIYLRRDDETHKRAASRAIVGMDEDAFFSRSLVREVTEKGVAALVFDVESDERFAAAQSILATGIRSLVAAPLLDDKGALGMIVLSSRVGVRQFSEDDMELLVSVASVAALRLRNVSLLAEAAERRRLEQELALGRRIQVALMTAQLPAIPGWDLHAGNIPSRGVSGDYYQVLQRGEGGECLLIVVDVSGKGIAASLLTASLEALSAVPVEDGQPPQEICAWLSRLLYRRTPPEKYATAFFAALDPVTGVLRYANAGHNPGLLVRTSGDAETLGPTGMPLGLMPDGDYEAGEVTLAPGDILYLYTDGITEPADPDDEEYGLERLTEVCVRHRDASLAELATAIDNNLEDFVRGEPFPDDRTFVIARRHRD